MPGRGPKNPIKSRTKSPIKSPIKSPRKRPTRTPETRRIAAAQALIRRCHSDAEFRKKMVALWRAQLARVARRITDRERAVEPESK